MERFLLPLVARKKKGNPQSDEFGLFFDGNRSPLKKKKKKKKKKAHFYAFLVLFLSSSF